MFHKLRMSGAKRRSRYRERHADRQVLRAERRLRNHDYGEAPSRALGESIRKGRIGP
jgi:hypothetical protein